MATSNRNVVPALDDAFSAVDSIRDSVERIQAKWPAERLKALALLVDILLQALNAEIKSGRVVPDKVLGHLQKLLLFVGYAKYRLILH